MYIRLYMLTFFLIFFFFWHNNWKEKGYLESHCPPAAEPIDLIFQFSLNLPTRT